MSKSTFDNLTENEVRTVIVHDLRQWAAETGRPLPYPAHHIAELEMVGAIVDLETGAVTWPAPAEAVPA